MIQSIDAINLIRANCPESPVIDMPLEKALGYFLARDVPAPMDFPPFPQSAMDGYVLADQGFSHYNVVGMCKAGDHFKDTIRGNEAIRIFTGAMTPESSYAVIPQELVHATETGIDLNDTPITKGMHIRPKGEQIREGEIALKGGVKLNAGNIGFLAMLGIQTVQVCKRPKVGIITTGSELCSHDQPLGPGKIYESNSYMLEAALFREGLTCESTYAEDDIDPLKNAIQKSLDANDVVILTGGISAGDYDLVREALSQLGVETILYKVAQKPGKPLFVGKLGSKIIFGLPGNPGAALTCFYVYVIPAIRAIQGRPSGELLRTKATLASDYYKPVPLCYFLKGKLLGSEVTILPAQSSAMLRDFGAADCLVVLDGTDVSWQKGDSVEIIILPD